MVSEGDAALVFTQYVAMGHMLEAPPRPARDARSPSSTAASRSPAARRWSIAFQAGDLDVLVISVKAGGTGLNLTRATHVLHYDRWWNPAVEDQASDRAWRIGQDRPVQVHRMVCEGTVEDRIAALLESKRALADAVVTSGEGWVSDLDDGALRALVELGDVGPTADGPPLRRHLVGPGLDRRPREPGPPRPQPPPPRPHLRPPGPGRPPCTCRPGRGHRVRAGQPPRPLPGPGARADLHRRRVGARSCEAIAGRAAHAAALLDGELDPSIVEDARDAGVDLLPGPGDLRPRCSCPDWADPCKHAAAVCYLVADALDEDPFALFTIRGRPRDALMAELRDRRRAGAGAREERGPPPGRRTRARWHATSGAAGAPATEDGRPGDAPGRAADPGAAGHPRPLALGPTPHGPLLLRGPAHPGGRRRRSGLGPAARRGRRGAVPRQRADLARRAAGLGERPADVAHLAQAAGTPAVELARAAEAWRHGGDAALRALADEPWRPPVAAMAEGRAAVADSLPASTRVQVSSNRVTAGTLQLRLDRHGRWWRFEKRRGRWEITARAAEQPDDLLALDD